MSLLISGLSIAKGVAIGNAYIMTQGQIEVPEYHISDDLIDSEVDRYTQAVKTTRQDLQAISNKISSEVSIDIADFISSHILTLDEAAINRIPKVIIRKQKINAEWALKQQSDELIKVLNEIDNNYLHSRQNDIMQVANIILQNLNSQDIVPFSADDNVTPRIIITEHLNPSDLVLLEKQSIAGFVSEFDAPTSHTSIMAQNLEVPVITGIRHIHQYIKDGELVLIDGKYGTICINPDKRSIEHYRNLKQRIKEYKLNLQNLSAKPAITLDKQKICLYANLDFSFDLKKLNKISAEGVGLYRTEFLFLNRKTLPDENEQLNFYRDLAELNIPINIRTLDVNADEPLPTIKKEVEFNNPMLGLRAIRFSLSHPDIFKTQLSAIIKASAYGKINIILPMIISLDELLLSKQYIREVMNDLSEKHIDFDPTIKIGVMVETPAMALSLQLFAKHVDFFAIGTNDLVQYILALDRADEQVGHLYDPCHPAVLNLIYQIIQTAQEENLPIYMCGEMASNTKYTRLLLGMGLKIFSSIPAQLLEIKKIIRNSSIDKAKVYVNEILKTSSSKRIKELISKLNHA